MKKIVLTVEVDSYSDETINTLRTLLINAINTVVDKVTINTFVTSTVVEEETLAQWRERMAKIINKEVSSE